MQILELRSSHLTQCSGSDEVFWTLCCIRVYVLKAYAHWGSLCIPQTYTPVAGLMKQSWEVDSNPPL